MIRADKIPITAIFGGAFLVLGLWMAAKACDFVAHAAKTTGTVVAVEKDDSTEGTMYHPAFVFKDAAGVEHRCVSSSGSSITFSRPGQQVTVLYDPAVPSRAELDSFQSIWLFPCLFTVAGAYFIANHYRWIGKGKPNNN